MGAVLGSGPVLQSEMPQSQGVWLNHGWIPSAQAGTGSSSLAVRETGGQVIESFQTKPSSATDDFEWPRGLAVSNDGDDVDVGFTLTGRLEYVRGHLSRQLPSTTKSRVSTGGIIGYFLLPLVSGFLQEIS